MINVILACIAYLVFVVAWAIRMEIKIAKMQTDLVWIVKRLNSRAEPERFTNKDGHQINKPSFFGGQKCQH